jgi:glycerol-1-phosphate dehydrogenase [NAD(P)+]
LLPSCSSDALYPGNATHGEQVAVGALFATFLRGDELLDALDAALRRNGVARLPADLGLADEEFAAAVAHAPSTRPDRFTVLEHLAPDPASVPELVDAYHASIPR